MLTVALTLVQVVSGYRSQPKCVFMTILFTAGYRREQYFSGSTDINIVLLSI